MPRLRDRSVLVTGVTDVLSLFSWDQEGFALADAHTDGGYEGLAIPHSDPYGQITDSTLLVLPARALAQRAAATPAPADDDSTAGGATSGTGHRPGKETRTPAPDSGPSLVENDLRSRFFGVYRVSGVRYGKAFKDVQEEILQHLADPDTELEITIEIKAHRSGGFEDNKQRIVSENAHVLKFDQADFED